MRDSDHDKASAVAVIAAGRESQDSISVFCTDIRVISGEGFNRADIRIKLFRRRKVRIFIIAEWHLVLKICIIPVKSGKQFIFPLFSQRVKVYEGMLVGKLLETVIGQRAEHASVFHMVTINEQSL